MSLIELLRRPVEAPSEPQEDVVIADEDDTDEESDRSFWRRQARLAGMHEADSGAVEAVS